VSPVSIIFDTIIQTCAYLQNDIHEIIIFTPLILITSFLGLFMYSRTASRLFFLGLVIAALGMAYGINRVYAAQRLAAPSINRMIVFGDSYSDNGNDYKLTAGKYPNSTRYHQGRFSDGPVWAEYFAKFFTINPDDRDHFIDLAYGQAKILNPTDVTVLGSPNKTYSIPDLSQQIDTYVKQHKRFNSKDLVVVFISTNDFFDMPETNAEDFFQKAAEQQVLQIDRLIKLGATQIVVLNGRDVTLSPLAKIFAHNSARSKNKAEEDAYLNRFEYLIALYNKQLAAGLNKKPEVFVYDTHKFDNEIIDQINQGGLTYTIDNKKYIMTNAKSSCYQNDQGDYQGVAGSVCDDSSGYFFYDRIHTTKHANYLLAKDIYRKFSYRP